MRKLRKVSRRGIFVFAALVFTALGTAFAADIPEDLKCMVCGKPALSDFAVDWNGGKEILRADGQYTTDCYSPSKTNCLSIDGQKSECNEHRYHQGHQSSILLQQLQRQNR